MGVTQGNCTKPRAQAPDGGSKVVVVAVSPTNAALVEALDHHHHPICCTKCRRPWAGDLDDAELSGTTRDAECWRGLFRPSVDDDDDAHTASTVSSESESLLQSPPPPPPPQCIVQGRRSGRSWRVRDTKPDTLQFGSTVTTTSNQKQ
jgi:hypothetical protein